MKPTIRLLLFMAVLGAFVWLSVKAEAAQAPQDVKLPDRLVSVRFEFQETLVDAAGVKPTVTRPKGSVELPLSQITGTITISVFNPASKEMEPVTYSAEEVAALLRAIGEKKWAEANPPALPVNRRSLREPVAVASLPAAPKPATP